jgi:TonB family protein
MLTASNGLSVTATPALNAQMPVCGDKGLKPSDFVIFAFAAGPFLGRQLVPVGASRTAAVAPFQDAIGAILPVKEGDGAKPLGTVFKVSCRSVVHVRFVNDRTQPDPILPWFVEKGTYPAMAFNEADNDHLNYVADRVDSLTAKFGKNNPLVLEAQWQRLSMLTARAQAGDPVLPGQIGDLAAQVSAGLRTASAPEWMAAMIDAQASSLMQAQAGMTPDEQMAVFTARIREQLQKLPVKVSYPLFQGLLATLPDQWPSQAAQLVLDYSPRALPTLTGRQRQAWLITLAGVQRDLGREAEAKKTIAGAGLEKDLCAAADSPVSLLEQHFSYDDYPDELIANEQEGTVFYEFNLTPTGSVTEPRVVYSLPTGLFDNPSAKGLSTVRYTPPIKQGKASSCRAVYQPIIWRLEGSELMVPQLMPDIGPTT